MRDFEGQDLALIIYLNIMVEINQEMPISILNVLIEEDPEVIYLIFELASIYKHTNYIEIE